MRFQTVTALLALAAASTVATPMPVFTRDTSAAELIAKIAPGSLSCRAGEPECRTNTQAAPFLIASMQRYGLTTYPEIAASLALMAFESVDFRYKRNVSPGRPGQGTANMQMWNFNLEYAKSIPELQDKVAALGYLSEDNKAGLDALLSLVIDDQYNFGSGPWFLTTKCAEARKMLQAGTALDAAWTAYMTCVGVSTTDEGRLAKWAAAKTAFGLA
jgi:hypothetical protein